MKLNGLERLGPQVVCQHAEVRFTQARGQVVAGAKGVVDVHAQHLIAIPAQEALVVGEATVRSHVSAILRKLQLASRTQAVLYALREGLVALDDAPPSH